MTTEHTEAVNRMREAKANLDRERAHGDAIKRMIELSIVNPECRSEHIAERMVAVETEFMRDFEEFAPLARRAHTLAIYKLEEAYATAIHRERGQ